MIFYCVFFYFLYFYWSRDRHVPEHVELTASSPPELVSRSMYARKNHPMLELTLMAIFRSLFSSLTD